MEKDNKIIDDKLIESFNQTNSIQEKLQYFSKIKNCDVQIDLLNTIPNNEKYKFIGKLKSIHSIAKELNELENDEAKIKTFKFISKQFKGKNEDLLKIISELNFSVKLPDNMLTFKLNNINGLSIKFLMDVKSHINNFSDMKFKLNEIADSKDIEYSFIEMALIIKSIEELTKIDKDMDEANKFYKIYSRIANIITYDRNALIKLNELRNNITSIIERGNIWSYKKELLKIIKNPAGLYGGLVDGKAICSGFSLILCESLKYVGIKTQFIAGTNEKSGHAWNQVQIDGIWYNTDVTWDASIIQAGGKYENMLLNDEDFNKNHGIYFNRVKTAHICKKRFDYSKIKDLSPNQIKTEEIGDRLS